MAVLERGLAGRPRSEAKFCLGPRVTVSRRGVALYEAAIHPHEADYRPMAGHSQFKNIMHRKGAQDARRARQFARVIREITVSARHGLPDPAPNPRLRAAVKAARQGNMPKDTG